MFNPSSMNNLELRKFALSLSNHASLDSWASDAGRASAVQLNQIQENEVMQVASLYNTVTITITVEPALASSGHIYPDDAFDLQFFVLELNILQQAIFWLINLRAL